MHFSFPGETSEFLHQAAPIIIRLIAAMGYAPRSPSVKAVHANLLRVVHADRVKPEGFTTSGKCY